MSTAVETLADTLATTTIHDGPNGSAAANAAVDAAAISAEEGRRLYIGNLAYATTEGELKEFFKNYTMYVPVVLFARGVWHIYFVALSPVRAGPCI